MNTTDAAQPPGVKSAQRTLRILEVLGDARGPVSVPDLHRLTGYPRSSLHQLLRTLTASGWVESVGGSGSIAIGSRALLVGTSYLDRDAALAFGVRALELARDRTGYTSHYARLERGQVIYLATRETTHARRLTSRVGRQLPAHATALGKALLAERTPEEMGAYPLAALTAHTLTSPSQLRAQLHITRERGYAVEREENTVGIACVAVAVPYRIPATDAISCALPVASATPDEVARVAAVLLDVTGGLGATLKSEGIR